MADGLSALRLNPAGTLLRCSAVEDVADDQVGEDGSEHRGAERAADHPEEGRARRGRPQLLVGDGVLDRHDQHLHDQAQPEAEDDHVRRRWSTRRWSRPISDMR